MSVELPERMTAALQKVRSRSGAQRPPLVEFPRTKPALDLHRRNEAVSHHISELTAQSPWYPDAWTPAKDAASLQEQVDRQIWYHTIELPGGVVTPGYYDHRALVPHYGLPTDLTGQRVLDVGAWDGFWSFEFERRGATVTAVDIDALIETDFPPPIRQQVIERNLDQRLGGGFEIARRAIGSKVERIVKSVYDLDPAEIGTFDLVHFADVSLHLERPLEAFRHIRSVTAGRAMIVDSYNAALQDADHTYTEYLGGWSDVQWWWPSLNTLGQMVLDAGFADVRLQTAYRLNPRAARGYGHWRALLIAEV